jgi:hypothetical protein
MRGGLRFSRGIASYRQPAVKRRPMTTRYLSALGIAALAGVLLLQPSIRAQQVPPATPPGALAQIVAAIKHDRSRPLREIPETMEQVAGEREVKAPMPVKLRLKKPAGFRDPVLQQSLPAAAMPGTSTNFDGVNNINGVLPPDTNGDVGPNHYVQWVNLSLAIYNKSGTRLYGPTNGNTIFSGFGGPCETRNDGDPIVLYDERADRWLLSQFALPNYPKGPFYQCIAVSATPDPTGAYNRYQFSFNKMNDYPKFGVWADGYYMAFNQFAAGSGAWAGQGVAVFERDKMIAGTAARMVYIDMASDATLGGMLPADLDGQSPPAGAPNLYMQFDDNPDQLQLWAFHADWTNAANAGFTKIGTLATAAFDSNMCNGSRNCIPQPGTTAKLDAIADRLMYRLQYRNLGSYEAWVVNHTVDASGADRGGVRWYEIRKANNAYSIYQQGTYSPDATNRWMASAAMDSAGNIALAYNTSGSSTYPSVRYTGRLVTDTLGQMTQGEADIIGGAGSQTSTSSRWGDYSMLAVDPTDGCTFWATLEYQATTGGAPWRTRIASFKFPNCGAPPPPAPDAPTGLGATAVSSSQISLAWTDNATTESGFKIERCTGANCDSNPANFTQIATVGANVTTFGNTGLTASTTYVYRVRAYNAGGDSNYSNSASAMTSAAPLPAAPTNLTATALATRRIRLNWVDNANNETSYEVWRNSVRIRSGLAANTTSYTDSGLTRGATYQYQVKACNTNGCSASNTASATAR